MTEEIKAAAERLIICEYDANGFVHNPIGGKPHSQAVDGHYVARAYLAEHPSDDGEPITEDWLSGLGAEFFPATDYERPMYILSSSCRRFGWELARYEEGDEWTAELTVNRAYHLGVSHDIKTRGDVRRLCSALGIELEEGK